MNNSEYDSFAEKLDKWLRQYFGIDAHETGLINLTPSGNLTSRYWISDTQACNLYLRLWPKVLMDAPGRWPSNTLVIAHIEFASTRAGHGHALLKFFVRQAERYGYDKIALEGTHDGEGVQGFAKKFGFEYAWPNLKSPHSNWIASIANITKKIAVHKIYE